jgi:predicted transcriptional regulator
MAEKNCGISLLEANILLIVWDRGRITTREVHESMLKKEMKEKDEGFTPYTTAMSTLAGLAKKNILKVNKSQKTYFYSPVLNRKELAKLIIRAVGEKLL